MKRRIGRYLWLVYLSFFALWAAAIAMLITGQPDDGYNFLRYWFHYGILGAVLLVSLCAILIVLRLVGRNDRG